MRIKYEHQGINKKIMAIVLISMTLITIICLLIWWTSSTYTRNYAEEVARPLEKSLIELGAVKVCSSGDSGRGPDNRQPHYGGIFVLPQARDKAVATVNIAASANGYNLNRATVDNRGNVPVADIYLDNWFYDTADKPSPYKDLQAGVIDLFFVVNNDGPMELSAASCNTKEPVKVTGDTNNSIVSLKVYLPQLRR